LELRVFEVSVIPGIHFHNVLKTFINGYESLHPGIQASICLTGLGDEVEILAPKLAKEHCRQLRYFIEKQKEKLLAQQDFQKNIIVSSVDSEDWKVGIETANFYNWKMSWTIPVYHHRGDLLAFITVFLDQARDPSEFEKNTLNRLRNLLRILMVNHLSLEQIRVSNERYNNMLRATHDLVWDWNLETGNFYRNKEGLKKVYGIDDEKTIQNVYSWMERIHPADHIKVQRVINDILHATDEDTFDVEYRFKRDDGGYAFIYDRGVIVRNREGKPLRMIGAAQNITDRKRLEQELLQQELDKQKFISQATIDTQEQERREIGKELHDNVNQVLTTTKLYLDLSLSSPDLKDELIKKSTKNIIYVINEIRQLSRSLMDPSIGDLGLLDSINDLVENINITRKLHVSLSAAPDLEQHLDESQKLMIFRVIQEAMNNTIKYAQATSVQLNIKTNAGNLELTIADDGKGFNIATVKKGAGLKNIQNRVYLTGGKLIIDSAPGQGCKMSITFPLNQTKSK
jgi:PAS domain S-box-containing protein